MWGSVLGMKLAIVCCSVLGCSVWIREVLGLEVHLIVALEAAESVQQRHALEPRSVMSVSQVGRRSLLGFLITFGTHANLKC